MKTQIWSTCYKLVKINSSGRYSSVLNDDLSIEYSLKKTNYPILGKLFVFDKMPTIEQTRPITDWDDSFRIYRCKGLNIKEATEICSVLDGDFTKFWKYPSSVNRARPVEGTYFADAVILTKNVTKEFIRANEL